MYKVEVNNLAETKKIAMKLGKLLFKGAIITLNGELGAGKTTFTQGIALSLHIDKTVNSPTFTIIKEYQGDLDLYHMDAYRLEDAFEDLGFDEYFYSDGVCVIEWAKNILDQIPKERLEINISVVDENKRVFTFTPYGKKYVDLCEVLFNEFIY